MVFLLGMFRGLWTLVATGGTAFCWFEHAYLDAGLWVLSTFLVSALVNSAARALTPPPVDIDAIGDRVFARMAERVDSRR
jgi:hypothetical protein